MSSRAFYGSRSGSRLPKGSRRATCEPPPPLQTEFLANTNRDSLSPTPAPQSQCQYWSPGQSLPTMTPPAMPESQPAIYGSRNDTTPCSSRYQHQRILTEVPWAELLASQKRLEDVVGNILERVTNLENAPNSFMTPQSSTSSSEPVEKKRIPPELSRLVADVYVNLDETEHFNLSESIISQNNKTVVEKIKSEIILQEENKYSPLLVNKAIRRYYDSRRRNFREALSPQKSRVESQAKKRKIRSRRQRLFDRRAKYVKTSKEQRKWSDLTVQYMSEETSGENVDDGDVIVVHHPKWRSQSLQHFIEKLDERARIDDQNNKKYTPKRKERQDGSYSDCFPPDSAPKWTVSKLWQQDLLQSGDETSESEEEIAQTDDNNC